MAKDELHDELYDEYEDYEEDDSGQDDDSLVDDMIDDAPGSGMSKPMKLVSVAGAVLLLLVGGWFALGLLDNGDSKLAMEGEDADETEVQQPSDANMNDPMALDPTMSAATPGYGDSEYTTSNSGTGYDPNSGYTTSNSGTGYDPNTGYTTGSSGTGYDPNTGYSTGSSGTGYDPNTGYTTGSTAGTSSGYDAYGNPTGSTAGTSSGYDPNSGYTTGNSGTGYDPNSGYTTSTATGTSSGLTPVPNSTTNGSATTDSYNPRYGEYAAGTGTSGTAAPEPSTTGTGGAYNSYSGGYSGSGSTSVTVTPEVPATPSPSVGNGYETPSTYASSPSYESSPTYSSSPYDNNTASTYGSNTTSGSQNDFRTAQTQQPQHHTYEIQPGDNFSNIAERAYGNADAYHQALAYHNRDVCSDDRMLKPGMVIEVPTTDFLHANYKDWCRSRETIALEQERARVGSSMTPVSYQPGVREYQVQDGDSLFNIAKYELGNKTRWVEIYHLNRELLSGDPDRLSVGMTLRLPPASGTTSGTSEDTLTRRSNGTGSY